MDYKIEFSEKARHQMDEWNKSGEDEDRKKLAELLGEIATHPRQGRGQVEELRHEKPSCWSRRIDHEDRILYTIDDEQRIVVIESLRKHYDDK